MIRYAFSPPPQDNSRRRPWQRLWHIRPTTVPARPRLQIGPLQVAWHPQWWLVTVVTTAILLLLSWVSLVVTDATLSPQMFTAAPLTDAIHPSFPATIPHQVWRPAAAILAGMLLGLSGALTQTVTGKTHASADVTGGVGAGAAAAAAVALVPHLPGVTVVQWVAAWVVGAAVFRQVWRLARRHRATGVGSLLGGIVITLLAQAIAFAVADHTANVALLTTAVFGACDYATAEEILLAAAVLVVCGGFTASHQAQFYRAGIGRGLGELTGLRLSGVRGTMTVATCAAAAATVLAGPLLFVAFLSPIAARKLVNSGTGILLPATLLGATATLACDIVAQLLPGPVPCGMLTAGCGAVATMIILTRITTRSSL
ncbi:putative siderophore transport system permease protein YfhA [Corynebacterium choanae]|uniref:Putative siderophore transport system permease protein YfhA n=2 Tax=Corynebacterium choanae TaxID=1862358 RepID=A0A3G6JE19_9CORY|nr:putative siderophore transport system permease protein YfhA [Corynebacterium choanae]